MNSIGNATLNVTLPIACKRRHIKICLHLQAVMLGVIFILQVFVANPNKSPPIQEILVKNKDKLVEFLTTFHNDRTGISKNM